MINKYTNKQRGLLAVIMAMVMVFAGAAFVAAEVDGAKITYISGDIKASQTYGDGTIVVVNDDLNIINGATLTILSGASFTVNSGVTLTVDGKPADTTAADQKASFVVEYGALVNIDGTLTIGENGDASLVTDVADDVSLKEYYKYEEYGFFINGTVNVQKGGIFEAGEIYTSLMKNENFAYVVALLTKDLPGVIINDGAVFNVTSIGTKVSEISGEILLRDGATFNMSGVSEEGLVVFSTGASKLINVEKDTITVPAAIYIVNESDEKTSTSSKVSNLTITAGSSTDNVYLYDKRGLSTDSWTSEDTYKFIQAEIEVEGVIQNEDYVETEAIGKDILAKYVTESLSNYVNTFDGGNAIANYLSSIEGVVEVQETPGLLTTDEVTKLATFIWYVGFNVYSGADVDKNEFWFVDSDGEEVDIGSKILVSDVLSIGKTGTFAAGMGTLAIEGTVNVNKEGYLALYDADVIVSGEVNVDGQSLRGSADHVGTLTIDGGVVVISNYDDKNVGTIKLSSLYTAMYKIDATGSDAVDVMYLCDLDVAVEAAAGNTDINVINVFAEAGSENNAENDYEGGYIVKKSFDLPENVTLIVGNALIVEEDIVINIPESSAIEAFGEGGIETVIYIEGKVVDKSLTLDVDDKDCEVVCQVLQTTDEGATQIFTSLELALRDAVAGDVIELVGEVVVKDTLTIPAGITVDTNKHDITVPVNKVLIVDGTLDMVAGGSVILKDAPVADTWDSDGKIIVNNMIVEPSIKLEVNDTVVAGIYADGTIGDYKGKKFLLAPAVAAENSSTISNATVDAETTYNGDLTFTAGEDNTAVLTVNSKFTVGTITIVGYKIIIDTTNVDANTTDADAIFTGKVAATNGALDLKSVKPTTVDAEKIIITNIVDEDAGTDVLTIAGEPVMVDKDGKGTNVAKNNVASISIASGTVTVDKSAILDVSNLGFTVAEGTVLDVNGTVKFNKMTIAGTANVNGNAKLDGVTIGDTDPISAVLEVLGTLSVKQATADDNKAGTVAVAGDVFVGVLKKSITTNVTAGIATIDAASIDGCMVMYVAAGSSIPEELVEEADSIQFVIEDTLYITAYQMDDGSTSATVKKAPVENAEFLGWNDDKGKLIINETSKKAEYNIPFADYDKVTAAIDYNIYSVYIVADNGIGTVAIDGIVLQKNGNTFYTSSKLVAGEHTLSYELKNGYEGTVKMTVDGKAVDGYKFTLSGIDAEDLVVDINLSGTTQIEYSTATDSGEDDGGMTLVEILLIVLVVLVVILAIIVALRMMRS